MQNYETATVDCVLVVPTNPYLSPIDETRLNSSRTFLKAERACNRPADASNRIVTPQSGECVELVAFVDKEGRAVLRSLQTVAHARNERDDDLPELLVFVEHCRNRPAGCGVIVELPQQIQS